MMRFLARIEQLLEEGLGPWLALSAVAIMMLALIQMEFL